MLLLQDRMTKSQCCGEGNSDAFSIETIGLIHDQEQVMTGTGL